MAFSVYSYPTNTAALKAGDVITLAYGLGDYQAKFLAAGHQALGKANQWLVAPTHFTVAFGPASISVTWAGPTIPLYQVVKFQFASIPSVQVNGLEVMLADGTNAAAGLTFPTLRLTTGAVVLSTPALDASQTWNAGAVTFTGLKLNVTDTASAAGSLLADFQKAGVSQFSVDKSGNVTATGQLVVATGIQNGGASQTGWGGRSQLSSPADGNLKLANNAGTSFGLLQFGGTTSSFPAIKRNNTNEFALRLADDSGPTNLSVAGLLATANITLTAGVSEIVFGASARIDAPAVGNIALSATGLNTSFGLLQFGGTSNLFPALKRTTTVLAARLADDSGDAPMTASVFTGQTGLSVASGGYHNWNSRSVLRSPADGQITLLDSTETTFGRLNIGGTTNAFPALKRSGTVLQFRLADDTAYCGLRTSSIQLSSGSVLSDSGGGDGSLTIANSGATSSVTLTVGSGFLSTAAGRLMTYGDGVLQALTDGASIAFDTGNGVTGNAKVTLGGNRTLANPTNLKEGASGLIQITQDGTGSRTLAYGTAYKFPGGAPSLSTAAGAVDAIAYTVVDAATPTLRCTLLKAFA